MRRNYKKGNLIIWNSGFGYDIGVYSKDKGVLYDTCEVDLCTGVVGGPISVNPSEVIPFNKFNIELVNDKYQKDNVFFEYSILLDRLTRYAETKK